MSQANLAQMRKLSEELLDRIAYLIQIAEHEHNDERLLEYEEMLEIATRVNHDIQIMIAESRRLDLDPRTEPNSEKGAPNDPFAE